MVKMSEKIIRYDLETEIDHGIEVSNLAYATAKELGLAENLCYELAVAGMVHDIGKLRLSRYMSGEENPLVIEEIKYVRRHTPVSYTHLDVYKRQYQKYLHFSDYLYYGIPAVCSGCFFYP